MAKYYYSIDRSELIQYRKSTTASLKESKDYLNQKFDVFISHSYKDKDIVENFVEFLNKKYGISCFVDWKEDIRNPDTAANKLKKVMKNCKVMLLLRSENSDNSYWIPWETGCFETIKDVDFNDGSKYIALLSITNKKKNITADNILDDTFKHMEFLKRYATLNNEGNFGVFFKNIKME